MIPQTCEECALFSWSAKQDLTKSTWEFLCTQNIGREIPYEKEGKKGVKRGVLVLCDSREQEGFLIPIPHAGCEGHKFKVARKRAGGWPVVQKQKKKEKKKEAVLCTGCGTILLPGEPFFIPEQGEILCSPCHLYLEAGGTEKAYKKAEKADQGLLF